MLMEIAMEPLANLPPKDPPPSTMDVLRRDMYRATEEIKSKKSVLTVHDLRRLLYRCAAVLISQKEVRSWFLMNVPESDLNWLLDLIRSRSPPPPRRASVHGVYTIRNGFGG